MIRYFLLLLLTCLPLFANAQVPSKASPFTAVKWSDGKPVVKLAGQWYDFIKLDHLSRQEILDYCQTNYPIKWKKRFSEDLVEVLKGMNYTPSNQVTLTLKKDGELYEVSGQLTSGNRQKVKLYNQKYNGPPEFISSDMAIADIDRFLEILARRSSYAHLSNYPYVANVSLLKDKVSQLDSVSVLWMQKELGTILGQIGDRHSSIRNMMFMNKHTYLPFSPAPYQDDKVLAVDFEEQGYSLQYREYPLLVSVNGKAIADILKDSDYEEVKAPLLARHFRQTRNLNRIEELLREQQLWSGDSLTFVFSNLAGTKQLERKLITVNRPKSWIDVGSCSANYGDFMESKDYDSLFKVLSNRIGYIAIPEMVDKEWEPGFFSALTNKMIAFKDTKALIIDIRDNGGGSRDILSMLAPYFIKPTSSPWVGNVAKVRVDSLLNQDIASMTGRGLYTYGSAKFDKKDRAAIDSFMSTFRPVPSFDNQKFSSDYFMTLRGDMLPGGYYYDKQVYLLMNERTFSAASVFASALKGMENITLAGVTSDGSSGLSKRFLLVNSQLIVRISRMASFQRNGRTLDGVGTIPDVKISRDMDQILGKRDTQLIKLIELINDSGN